MLLAFANDRGAHTSVSLSNSHCSSGPPPGKLSGTFTPWHSGPWSQCHHAWWVYPQIVQCSGWAAPPIKQWQECLFLPYRLSMWVFSSMLTIYVHYIRYSFDDQQALASLWTCKCRHICLYRHEFTLRTDHLKVSLPAQVPTTSYLHKHNHTWGPSSRYNKMEHDVIQLLHSVQNPWHWVSLWQLCYIVFAEFWCLLQRA